MYMLGLILNKYLHIYEYYLNISYDILKKKKHYLIYRYIYMTKILKKNFDHIEKVVSI